MSGHWIVRTSRRVHLHLSQRATALQLVRVANVFVLHEVALWGHAKHRLVLERLGRERLGVVEDVLDTAIPTPRRVRTFSVLNRLVIRGVRSRRRSEEHPDKVEEHMAPLLKLLDHVLEVAGLRVAAVAHDELRGRDRLLRHAGSGARLSAFEQFQPRRVHGVPQPADGALGFQILGQRRSNVLEDAVGAQGEMQSLKLGPRRPRLVDVFAHCFHGARQAAGLYQERLKPCDVV
eukprot:scaffold7066_cov253-Pinguiococcus_pyrenoidosus.AAC.14